MKLIEEIKEENRAIWWISKEPKKHGVGLKAIVAFDSREIELIEEDAKGKRTDIVIMSFREFRNLETIIEDNRRGKPEECPKETK